MDRPTEQSIEAAKQHQQTERAKVYAATGIHISDDGVPRIVVVHCWKPGCLYVVAKESQALAIRAVCTHYSLKHGLSRVGR